jgi:tetratricopeptide (TPR) repeat protein
LTVALKLNGTLFSTFEETKQFHTHILTLLGKCYLLAGGIEDAIGLLDKAVKMNHTIVGEDHITNVTIFQVLAEAYSKKKDYGKALDALTSVWEL